MITFYLILKGNIIMEPEKYKAFSNRLIEAMKLRGFSASRSPSGICIKTLAKFTNASEQICRRYIRGDALPDYDKIVRLSEQLDVSPGWLLFGEEGLSPQQAVYRIDDELLHHILKTSHHLYQEIFGNTDDYADFVIDLIQNIRDIDTSKENLEKIINLTIGSIASDREKRSANLA